MKLIILAGGKGKRLAPYTNIFPKPLMPIGEMPILEVILRQVKRAGIEDVIITVGHLAALLRTYFNDGKQWGLNIRYSYEEQPLGTAGPIAMVGNIDSTFVVANGDVLTTLDMKDLLRFHKQHGGIATIAIYHRPVHVDLGVVQCNDENIVTAYIEKPTYDFNVSMGIYVFEPEVLKYIPLNQYLDFPNLVLTMLAAGEKVVGYKFDGYWKDLGRPDDYQQANDDFLSMRQQFLLEDEK